MNEETVSFFRPDSPLADRPAVISDGATISYADFFRNAAALQRVSRDWGIEAGQLAGIQSRNSPDYLTALFALWNIGAVACLFSTRISIVAVGAQLMELDIKRLLITKDIAAFIQKATAEGAQDSVPFCFPFDQEATVMFTSGTSAGPKRVLHTFGNHYYSAKGANEHLPVIPGDQWLCSLPLYHVGGLGIVLRTFLGGGTVVIPGSDEPLDDVLMSQKITHCSLVPTQLARLLHNPKCHSVLKNTKAILLGGGPIPNTLIDEAVALGLPIYTTYGLTEMSSQVATSRRLTSENRASEGKILKYRQVILSEPQEILVKGETLFKGYLEKDRLHKPFDRNGYFPTGDIGAFGDDGTLIVRGRKDNMFISGGENIHPEEIEQYLARIKTIDRAIVVPVADDEFGFRPAAVIQTHDGNAPDIHNIARFLQDHLPKFKVPKTYYTWPDHFDAKAPKINRRELFDALSSCSPICI